MRGSLVVLGLLASLRAWGSESGENPAPAVTGSAGGSAVSSGETQPPILALDSANAPAKLKNHGSFELFYGFKQLGSDFDGDTQLQAFGMSLEAGGRNVRFNVGFEHAERSSTRDDVAYHHRADETSLGLHYGTFGPGAIFYFDLGGMVATISSSADVEGAEPISISESGFGYFAGIGMYAGGKDARFGLQLRMSACRVGDLDIGGTHMLLAFGLHL